MSINDSESIPISIISHWKFCPRRAWLEAMGERSPLVEQLAAGKTAHKKVDTPTKHDSSKIQGVDIRHKTLGYHGRIDLATRLPNGSFRLTEYKATPVKLRPEITETNRLQLTLQLIAMEDMGNEVSDCEIYFPNHHKSVPVELDFKDREVAVSAINETRQVIDNPKAPPPLLDDPKCMRCSHSSICLPEERQEAEVRRRIMVPDPGAEVLHLTTPGSRATIRTGRVVVTKEHEEIASLPLERIAAVVVHGNVDLSGALIRELLWLGVACIWCTGAGRVVGWTGGAKLPNGGARCTQFSESAQGRMDLAREFIVAKISNQATILRRYGGDPSIVKRLRSSAKEAAKAPDREQLFGTEGRAAGWYFGSFRKLLARGVDSSIAEQFQGRVGRGAIDPLNVSLNYAYGIILGETTRAILACGLDPHAGFLHSSGRNKPALSLDLMEEFRAPIADSAVLAAFNNGEITPASFSMVLKSARFTQTGRKKLIAAVERRLSTEFLHPVFDYRMTWRRAIEVQARMVLGVLDGTQANYKGIRVR